MKSHLRAILLAILAAVPAGCGGGEPSLGTITFEPEGISGGRVFNIQAFEVWEFGSPDRADEWVILGDKACLIGKLWGDSKMSSGRWPELAGKHFDIMLTGGNPRQRRKSTCEIPEFGSIAIEAASWIDIDRVYKDGDQWVVVGRTKFVLETDKGSKRGIGAFKAPCRAHQVK